MIVKEGGASLSRCLESAKGVADEIVVVDTGSKDDSVERARAHGARVIERPWDDDFAAARNAGLEQARGEWILLLDCDEHLDESGAAALRRAIEDPKYVGYFLAVESELKDGEKLESTILRLWRHSPEVRFRYPIHEQVLPDLEAVAARTGKRFALLADVKVAHDGYTPAAIAAHGKVERNLRLFRKAVARFPDEPYLHYKFADFLRGHREHKAEALQAAQRALELVKERQQATGAEGTPVPKVPYWSELLTILCAARLDAGRTEEALALLEQEPPPGLGSPHYHYVAALACETAGRIDEAIEHVTRCCGATRPTHLTAWRPAIAGPLGSALKARLLLKKGDAAGALHSAERALELRPGWLTAIHLKAEALHGAGRAKDAVRLLLETVKQRPGERGVWRQLSALLARLGRTEEAERCRLRSMEPVAAS